MAETMVERVARAIAPEWFILTEDSESIVSNYPGQTVDMQRWAMTKARAAIEAMREPTEAMEDAAGGALCSAIESRAEDAIVCGAVYRAMIDAALAEPAKADT